MQKKYLALLVGLLILIPVSILLVYFLPTTPSLTTAGMEYFPLSPGSTLTYNSTSDDGEWLTRRSVAEETEFINGWIWGTFTVKWTEEHQLPDETEFTWVNHMWLSKQGQTLIWWGFEDENAKVIAYSGLKYVTEPVKAGAVHKGDTRGTLTLSSGKTIPLVPFSGTYTIDAIETVTVPAGIFENCIKVHEQETTPDGDISFWVWYAPGIAAVKYYYPDQANRTDVLYDYKVSTVDDPWDKWFLPKVPILVWVLTVAVGGVAVVKLISVIKKRSKPQSPA